MRISHTIVAATLTALTATLALEQSAAAQNTQATTVQTVARDQGWGTVSDVALAVAVLSPTLMPRVYYSDPTATVGWKGRWHFSVLAPAMTMLGATMLVDIPIKRAAAGPRPGCTQSQTTSDFPGSGSGCETFGGPSTHMFATYGALGTGTAMFLVDSLKYSDGRFYAPAFIGNVGLPLLATIFGTIGRAVQTSPVVSDNGSGLKIGTQVSYEDPGQIAAGAISGFLTGALVGMGYAMLQRPSCGYGDSIFCW
jgi:hypothetical protein